MTGDVSILIPHTRDYASAVDLAAALDDRVSTLEVTIARTPSETLDGLAEATVLLTIGIEEAWYDHLASIEWIQVMSAGVNHIDLDRLGAADVIVTNASGVHARPIAEQVLGYMLMFERNLLKAVHQQRRGIWERVRGGELGDKTVGIVGCGAIGTQVARNCSALGMHVVATKRDTTSKPDGVDELYGPDDLEDVLAVSDYLVLACPLTEETEGLIDYGALRILPRDAVLVNIARGGVIVEPDLVSALQRGTIAGAALDVFETEPLPPDSLLWDLSNVIVTPHMAGSTPHYWERCADLVARNVEPFLNGSLADMENRVL